MLQQSKESGVDLDFDEIMASSSSQKDHSLKSPYAYTRSAVPSLPPDASAVRPPRPQFPSMTNLKQQLQRHQAEQEEKRLRDLHASLGTPRASSAIRVPSIPDRLPPNLHVPTEILQVESRLENPTRYHVEQSKKRQVQQFLSSRTMLPQAQVQRLVAPPMTPGPTGSPFSPDSPVSHPHSGSGATSNSELDDTLDDFSHLENDDFLTDLGAGHATVPGSIVEFEDIWPGLSRKVSSSCPPDLALVKQEDLSLQDTDIKALVKDRQKKDNHNMIERRRRFNINDRIKELGTLLPRTNDRHYELVRDIRQNKGTILKATVDYVKTLKKENDRIPAMEERSHQLEQQNKQLLLRIQELEHQLQSNGIALSSQTWQPTTETQLSALLGQESTHSASCDPLDLLDFESVKNGAASPAPSLSSGLSSAPSASPGHALAHYDDIMDDDPVTCSGDPLLSSHVLQDSLCSPIHMDYHT